MMLFFIPVDIKEILIFILVEVLDLRIIKILKKFYKWLRESLKKQ